MISLPSGRLWMPHDEDRIRFAEVGDLVAWDFKPWRLISVRIEPFPSGRGRAAQVCVLRPLDLDPSWTAMDEDVHVRLPICLRPLHEHYGLCVHCGELLPCRAREAEVDTGVEMRRMARFETPGVCPACSQPVTDRMKSEMFPNIVAPLGPPVTFHAGRRLCRDQMEKYRRKLAKSEGAIQERIDNVDE